MTPRWYADPSRLAAHQLVVCADVGSTYTKVMLVDVTGGELIAAADHPTTAHSDVLDGLDAAVAALGDPAREAPV
ncbi:MAG: glutamate mutase L, partial [Micromonosporaceae bacterium]